MLAGADLPEAVDPSSAVVDAMPVAMPEPEPVILAAHPEAAASPAAGEPPPGTSSPAPKAATEDVLGDLESWLNSLHDKPSE